MSELILKYWDKTERKVQFIGYNRDLASWFICNETRERRVIKLYLPNYFRIKFRRSPLPDSPPVEIRPAALHVPPCFASQEEADEIRQPDSPAQIAARVGEPWKLVSTHQIWLQTKHDRELAEKLTDEQRRLRLEKNGRKKEITELIAAQNRLRLRGRHKRLTKEQFKSLREITKLKKLQLRSGYRVFKGDGRKTSVFKVNLDMVRHGVLGIRDKLLEPEWARHHGFDLKQISVNCESFHHWLSRAAFNITLSDPNTKSKSGVLHILHLTADQWEVLEAAINFEVRFADGSRVWVRSFEDRSINSSAEADAYDRIVTAQNMPAHKVQQWHSPDFSAIFRLNKNGERIDEMPLPNELKALLQILQKCSDQTGQYSELEPKIGRLAHELDKKAEVETPTTAAPRRIRDLIRTKPGKTLVAWRVLETKKSGREKFLKLSPPQVVK